MPGHGSIIEYDHTPEMIASFIADGDQLDEKLEDVNFRLGKAAETIQNASYSIYPSNKDYIKGKVYWFLEEKSITGLARATGDGNGNVVNYEYYSYPDKKFVTECTEGTPCKIENTDNNVFTKEGFFNNFGSTSMNDYRWLYYFKDTSDYIFPVSKEKSIDKSIGLFYDQLFSNNPKKPGAFSYREDEKKKVQEEVESLERTESLEKTENKLCFFIFNKIEKI